MNRFNYSAEELIEKAAEMRAFNMIALTAAGSGHTGGTLSIMDIAAVLYLKVINHDPSNPDWDDRDRVFWSAGHKAPALYVTLGMAGYFPIEETVKLRKLGSGFEGHPNRFDLPGIEISSGSMGQGLGVAVGSALRARLDGKKYRVYCIMGDGEHQEGSVWEAVMSAAHYRLDNLIGIVDLNGLQIDGTTDEVMGVAPLEDKYRSFGWEVFHADGHDIEALISVFEKAEKISGRPSVIIAKTIKGKGVSFAENVVGYHGIPPKDGRFGNESLEKALADILGEKVSEKFPPERVNYLLEIAEKFQAGIDRDLNDQMPVFRNDYWWNRSGTMRVEMDPTRMGFGRALKEIGDNPDIVAFGADITSSIKMDEFFRTNPERRNRFFNMGIAEQNMTTVAAGFAKEGKTAFIGSYGIFVSGRNWDQIRTTLCYNNLNVKIAGAHGGISVGPDGATHQALEEIPLMYYLPNMRLVVPCDSLETEKATRFISSLEGPAYIRFGREATPVVTGEKSPYEFGVANIIRFRDVKDNFTEAYEIILSSEYMNEGEDLSIISCGPMVAEAMRAAWILKQESGIEARIINVHTVKPLDVQCLVRAADETGVILTVEEQQTGGFGNIIAGSIVRGRAFSKPFALDMMGVDDMFGASGSPWDLMKKFGLSAEHIADKAMKLLSEYKSLINK
ncbi:MAG TPA: transketolase [Bacteroidales bacterium]|nr:transketolase [Bacteroidales bacterium]